MTCQHKPFLANNGQVSQAWDTCMGLGMNTTIDSGHNLPHQPFATNMTLLTPPLRILHPCQKAQVTQNLS